MSTTLTRSPRDEGTAPSDLQAGTLAPGAVAATGLLSFAAVGSLLLALGSFSWVGLIVLGLPVFMVVLFLVSSRLEGRRRAKDRVVTVAVCTAFALAMLPLASLLLTTISSGASKLTPYFLQHSMRGVGPREDTGGVYHAIIGTVEQVGIATVVAVPLGLLVAIYLTEYGRGRLAKVVTFFVDVMTGVPSIVAGLFIFTLFIVILHLHYAGWLGSLALMILMLPVVVRTSEEMLKLVPRALREASMALGVPQWRTILSIVLPTALAGIITGIMLSIARVIGETAPLVLTTAYTDSINLNPLSGPQMSLPLYIYNQAGQPSTFAVTRAWGAALTLVLIILLLNAIARTVAWWKAPKSR